MTSKQLLEEIKGITSTNIEVIRKRIIFLNDEQKSWKPNKNAWSINEIFAHLNEFVKFYHPTFQQAIATTKYTDPVEIYTPSPLGKSAWKSMKLGNLKNIKRKFKSARSYNPSIDKSLIKGEDVSNFESAQKELIEIIDSAYSVNLRKVKVPVSISKIIRFRLGDALLFVTYHNERHMQQALNVVNHPLFPRKK
jgi:hypothetical protein